MLLADVYEYLPPPPAPALSRYLTISTVLKLSTFVNISSRLRLLISDTFEQLTTIAH